MRVSKEEQTENVEAGKVKSDEGRQGKGESERREEGSEGRQRKGDEKNIRDQRRKMKEKERNLRQNSLLTQATKDKKKKSCVTKPNSMQGQNCSPLKKQSGKTSVKYIQQHRGTPA